MTIRGHIENGVVVLDDKVELPNGTHVLVSPTTKDGEHGDSSNAVYSVLNERIIYQSSS